MKFLVKEKKGYSFRLLCLETEKTYRVFQRDFKNIDFVTGSLLTVSNINDEELLGDLISSFTVDNEIMGDSSKKRVEVCVDDFKIGDLIDGVPILNFGIAYAKDRKKMRYAYFK